MQGHCFTGGPCLIFLACPLQAQSWWYVLAPPCVIKVGSAWWRCYLGVAYNEPDRTGACSAALLRDGKDIGKGGGKGAGINTCHTSPPDPHQGAREMCHVGMRG